MKKKEEEEALEPITEKEIKLWLRRSLGARNEWLEAKTGRHLANSYLNLVKQADKHLCEQKEWTNRTAKCLDSSYCYMGSLLPRPYGGSE